MAVDFTRAVTSDTITFDPDSVQLTDVVVDVITQVMMMPGDVTSRVKRAVEDMEEMTCGVVSRYTVLNTCLAFS